MFPNVTEVCLGPTGATQWSVDPSDAPEKLALIIPTLHEAGNISALLQRVRKALDPLSMQYEVIIVDDDSQDGIAEIVRKITDTDPRIRLITRRGARGLAGAIIHGWQNTDATIVAAIDADFQHPPELLPVLLREFSLGADLVVASRYAAGGSLNKWNRYRHLFSWLAIMLTVPLQKRRLRVTDPMSGFFMVRRHCIQDLALQKSGFKILLEILVRGELSSVAEIPFSFGHRNAGESKASPQVAFHFLKLLLRLTIFRLFHKAQPNKAQKHVPIASDFPENTAAEAEILALERHRSPTSLSLH